MKLCLHLSNVVQNSLHFDEIFHRKFKMCWCLNFVSNIFFSCFFKVASELNAAILKAEHADNTQPKVAVGLKLVLWAQNELDKKRIRYNRMVDLSTGRVEDSK